MSDPTLGQRMSRNDRQKLTNAVAERNYGGGQLFAPIQFKADDSADPMKPARFQGFANTGHPDLGRDVVDPRAFTKQTIDEYLRYGRQLCFMHWQDAQVGEITSAKVVLPGGRSIVGNTKGGLRVEGFVDSPFDEFGMIPDHSLAKVIHFARMQVAKNRLKALSIGWVPVETKMMKMIDKRTGKEAMFRVVLKLILREVSLVNFAMSPQSLIELRKSFTGEYGEDIAEALFCEDPKSCEIIPEKVDGFNFDRIRDLVVKSSIQAILHNQSGGKSPESEQEEQKSEPQQMKIVSLDDSPKKQIKIVSLFGG